jgi:enoyl-CoA hydratase/carnithine racemase
MATALEAALAAADRDDAVRAIVVTGQGAGVCARTGSSLNNRH